jgi:hypothetical protein
MKKLLLALAAVLAGCATTPPTPMGPSILVLPGSSKTFDQFKVDDNECRNYATTQTTGDSNISLQRRYDYAYQQCMYARGHQVPSAVRYAPSGPSAPAPAAGTPPPPAGTPPPPPPAKSG